MLRLVLPADVRHAVLTELDTEYARAIRPSRSAAAAAGWYWRQSAGSIGPALGMRARRLLRVAGDASRDVRFAVRLCLRQKAFTAAVVATLALGIGANTAIFSVVDGVLLRPLPYDRPERLVRVWSANPRGIPRNQISPADFFDWRERVRAFEALAAFASADVTLTAAGDPVRLIGATATANLAQTLGRAPLAGRWFLASETRGGAEPVAVISERLWRDRFGAAPDLVGRSINIDGRAQTIVGVMPLAFGFPNSDVQIWLPLPDGWRAQSRSARFLGAVGRLRPGVTIDAARDDLLNATRQLASAYPEIDRGWSVTLTSLTDAVVGDVRTPLLMLLAAVAAVLLVACANVASLILARGVARARELAVRAAVGATAGRLLRMQLAESLLLSLLGGAAGLALAAWLLRGLELTAGFGLPMQYRVALDARVLAAAAGMSIVSAIVAGLLPAWRASRQTGASALATGTRASGDQIGMRQAIVFVQIAIATTLAVAGTLLIRSIEKLTAVPAGFTADQTLLLDIALPGTRYPRETRAAFYDRALERVRGLPGVQAAGAGGPLPLSGLDGLMRFGVSVEGRDPSPDRPDRAYLRWATPGYFTAMGIPLHAGRAFAAADSAASVPVAVIDEVLARRFFGTENPIGRRVMLSNEARAKTWREVIGVVGGVRQTTLDRDADPHIYVAEAQVPASELTMIVRAESTAAAAAGVRDVIHGLDADLPVANLRTLADLISGSTARRRFNAVLLSLFAAVAVLLTLVGVYGVIAQMVAQSAREVGVRIAMGASAGDVISLLLTRAVRLAAAGVAAGTAAAWLAAPALGGLLYGIAPRDPSTLAIVPALLVAAATLAAYLPARRILRLDVVHALRTD